MDTPNRKENIAKLLGFLKQNGYASKGLSLEGLDTRLQNDSLRRNLYNALSRDKVPDIGSWDEFSSMVKKEKDSTALAQPSTKATSTPLVPNSPLLPSPNKTSKNTLSTDWTKPTPQFSIPTSERNPGVPTLVPSREHPYVGRELAFVSPAEVTNQRTGKKHYDASKTSVIYPNEIGEDNTRKAIDNYTQAKASEANRLDRKIEAQLQDIEKQQKELEARLNKRAKELEAEREGEGWFANFIRSQPARGMDPMSTINRLTNDGKDQDEEYIGLSSALHNLRKQKEKLLATKKSMQEDASFGPFLKNVGQGFLDTVTDTRIWDGGEGDLREAGLAIKAIGKLELQKKFNSGQATKEDAELLRTLYKGQLKLTPAEDALLNSKAGRAYVDAITKEAIGYGYGAGETTANMLPFIRDIALSPVNGLGRTVATNVAKSALKSGLSRVATKAISRTARVVGDIALEGAGTALTTGMGGTLKGTADEQIGDIKYDVDSKTGQIVYGGRTNQEENFLKAFGKSLVRQALEYGTEATGGAYIGTLMKPINKYGGKLLTKTLGDKAVSAVEKFFARMEKTSVGKAVNSVGEQVHYDGLPGEYLEEVYNNLLNAITIGDMKLDTNSNNGVFNPEINKTIIIGLMGAPMATVSLKVGSIVAQDTKTQAMGLRAFGYKQWQEMKTLIGNSDDVSKTISEWAEQNPNATSNQKKAVMRYAVATAMEDAMTVRQALEQKERKKDSATSLIPSQTAEQSGGASAVAPNSSSSASESADNTFNPNSDNSKRYEQGNGVVLKREDGTSVRAQIVSEENEDGKIEVASSEGAIQGRDRVVYLTREELDQMYQGSFDINTPDASSNEETQLSDTSIDITPASPTPNLDSPIGRPMTEEEAVSFVDKMTAEAEEAPELELTAENWDKEFGDNGVVDTPIGQVHMGEHQFLKMMRQGRNSKLGMIKPTLTNPDIIIEDTSREASSSERSSSYIFAKSFKGTDGERTYYFASITISQDGNEVVISNQERRKNRILSLMSSGNILYQKSNSLHPKAQVGESVPLNESLSVTNADNNSDQLGIHSSDEESESKDSNNLANIKAEEEGSDHSTQEALSDTPHIEERSEEHEWDELSKQVGEESAREIISSDISDLEEERKKLQKEISKPKGQTREEKIQYVIGRRERLQSIDTEIEGLQRVLQVPQMRIAQAEAQEQEQNRIKAEEARRQEEHTDNQGNPINEDGTLKSEEVQNVDELTDEDFTASSRNSKKVLDAEQNAEGKVENEDARKSEDNSTEGIRFRRSQELQEVNERFNEQLQAQIDGTLPKGHVYSLGMPSDILQSAGIPNLPIELTASRVSLKSGQEKHPFPIKILSNLPQMLQKPIAVFHYGDKAMNVIVEIEYEGRDLLVGLVLNQDRNGIEIHSVRGLFPKDTAKWLNWITQGKAIYLNKEIIQTKITQQRTNLADVGHLNLDDLAKVIKEFENPNIEENAFDDDILFRGRYVEGQLGYTERADGTPISDNAKLAEEAGKFPASLFKKTYGISPADFKMLNDLGLIDISEWHHTGATFRETDYYSWTDNAIFDDGYNSIRGYDINGEYEYNEQGEATYVGEDENPSMPLSEWYKQNKKAIKPIADAYKAGEWTWEREDTSVGAHRIKNREDAERRMIGTHFRKEERQYRNIHWGEYPQSLKDLFSTMLKWDENAHYEDTEAEAERLANEFYDAHIEETLEDDRKKVEEGEAKNRAIREKNLSSASKETALMALAKLYGMDEQEAYNKISSSSYWSNHPPIRRRSTSSDEESERNQLLAEMEREATRLAHSMGEEVIVVHNEEELVDILGEDGARQARGAKGFYLPKSGKVVVILNNNLDVSDVLETIFHEFVGHKGLQEYVGKEEFTEFIDRVHKGLHTKALREIHDEAKQIFSERKGKSRAVSYQDAVREATEEYIARLSERGFSDRESRSTWQKIVDAFRDMISRAKLTIGWNIQDRDIRYILWKSFQMKQKQVAIFAEAGDIAMRHRLGLPQKVKVTEGVRERRATSNDVGTNRYNSGMRSVSSELDNKLAITTLSPSTEIPVVQAEKRSVSTAEAKQAIESLPKQVVTMDGYALNVSRKTKNKLGNNLRNNSLSDYLQALTLIPKIVGNSILIEEHRDRMKIDSERKADNPNDVNIDKTQRFYGAITIGGVTYRVKTTAIVSANTEQGTRMHNYDITEIELLPSSPTANSQELAPRSNSISLAKLLNGVGFSYEPERKILDEMQGGSESIRFRQGNNNQTSWNESAAKTEYNRATRITDENGNKSKSANLLWRLREAYQDSMLSLKALQDALAKNALGRDLRDFEDAYTAENAMGSKNLSEMEHYDARYVKPLTDAISELMKEGASYEDILNYLRAKHGLERNEYYNAQDRATAKDKWDSKEVLKQQKNPNYQPKEFEYKGEFKDYSGLTGLTGSSEDFTKLAQDMVEEFENKFNTDALWTSVRNANQKTLELGRQKNLISKQTYEHIKGMFEYYIPLRGWDSNRAEDEWEYLDGAGTMSGNSIRKSAKGRTSVSDDPIAMMIKLAEDTIRQGNRNMMKLKFLNLAENADDKLLQYSRAWFQKKIDQEGNEYWELVTPDIDDDASPEEVSEALLEFNQNMNNLKELGEATQYPPKDSRKNITFDKNGSLGERKQHTVTVYRGGQLYTIFVNGNPRAAQAINGSINAGQYSGQIEKIVGPFNRWISAMHTSYNPEFIITNAVRDFQHATFMIFAQEGLGSKYMKDFQKQYVGGLKRSLGLYKRWRSGTLDLSRNEDKMFHDFMINGGQTGYTQISKIEDLKKKVEWELKKAKGEAGRMKVGFEILQEGLELFNGAIELNTRFATFVASRKSGRSIERSISDAKNITVNFNKKGAGGYGAAFFQALYIFFNPAVQALEQSVRVSRKQPKRIAAMIGTMATLAYLQPILFELIGAASGGDDDDEDAYNNINQNSRLSSLIIRNPLDTSTYINLPISPELKPFFTLGSALAEVQRGTMTPSEATGQILQGMTSLLPLDPAGGNGDKKWINIVPSVVQPLEQVAVNTNYYGESIYKDNSFNKLDPEWTKAKDANPIFTKTSEILNEWSGGNKVRKGEIDINPEKVEHIVEGFTGGAGRATNALFKTFMMPFDSDMRKLNNTVMLRKFYKAIPQAKEGMLSPIIWKISDQFKDIEHEKNGYRKELQSNDPSEVSEYAQKLYDLKLSSEYNFYIRYRRSIDRLQDLRKKYKEANTDEGRKSISDLMNSIQERVLKAYKEEQQTE